MADTELVFALDIIKNVEKSLTAVIINQHQCRRLVDFYRRVGKLLTYLSKNANSSRDDDHHILLPSLLVTISVLQKGRLLIEKYTTRDWVGRLLTTDVNQGSFEAIHVELEGCIQSIYGARHIDLQVVVPMASVMPLLHLSEGDREILFDADANKDRTQMREMIETHKNTLSQSPHLNPKQKDEVRSLDMVVEKISESKSPRLFEELPTYLRIQSSEIMIGDRLGCGASADVYKCRWLHQDFAVKIFHGHNDAGMSKEIINLIPLRHPNIVQLIGFSVDREDQRSMLVMELLDCDLKDLINERVHKLGLKPFTLSESIDLIHQIAAGMAYLHKRKIFHGDLKSKNVLVAKHPGDLRCYALKISDFGVSQHVKTLFANDEDFTTSMSLTHGNIGTTRWMAPEVFTEFMEVGFNPPSSYSPKADVYSFAITCYEILTGENPYNKLSPTRVLKYILSGGRPELPDTLPRDLKELIVKCWDGEPSNRPSFSHICENIQQLLALPAEPAEPADPIEEPANRRRHRRRRNLCNCCR